MDENLGRAFFPAVTGAPGSIVLAQTGSCAIREFDLPTGLELPNVVARSTCQLWAAPVTAKVAVGVGEPVGDAVPFRFLDLGRPNRDLGSSEAAFGFLIWSDDGQRAAWCNRRLVGIDLELAGRRRQLDGCPAAYTPAGEIVYARGDRLYIGDRPGLRASGGITHVHYGSDGSVAVVVEGRRIERYVGRRLTAALDLPARYEGRLPELSPDNCSAAFRAGDRIRVLDVGLLPARPERHHLPRPCGLVVTGRPLDRDRRADGGDVLRPRRRQASPSSGRSARPRSSGAGAEVSGRARTRRRRGRARASRRAPSGRDAP